MLREPFLSAGLFALALLLGGSCSPPAPAGELASPGQAPALGAGEEVLQGRVVGVADGDTLNLLDAGQETTRVRLAGIDAPESSQDFGSRAKQALSDRVFGADVEVRVTDIDRYGRTVGDIIFEGSWINEELVRAGLAWHYTQYSSDEGLARAELAAREAGAGLWSVAAPVPPWDYRRGARGSAGGSSKPERGEPLTPDSTVFVTRTGKKYHLDGCRGLSRSRIPITLAEARLKYGPCGSCRPE